MNSTAELVSIRSQIAATLAAVDQLLKSQTPPPQMGDSDHVQSLPRTQAIEWMLQKQGGSMRPVEIWAELQKYGRNDPKMEIQVTTFDLWQRGRIGKVGRGQYVADPQ